MITSQVLLANAARQNCLCLRFFYDIYDSPHPATFHRVLDEPKEVAGPAEPPTPPPSGREKMPLSVSSIHITVHSELQPGSTGIVHIGTMAVDQSGPTTRVAVKLAFSRDEKLRLMEENQVYSYLHSEGVQGIPHNIGLFVDQEPLLGAEGPYALVMSYAGVSLFGHSKPISNSLKQVVHPFSITIDYNSICFRKSLLATLTSIHSTDVLHGDIRHSNICITASGEASLLDFSHASKGGSQKEKDREIRDLAYILDSERRTHQQSLLRNTSKT
jgi:serine/threonine protein kinase